MTARLAAAVAILVLALGGAAPRAAAQQIEIRQVVVEGNQRIEAATVLSYLTIQPGDMVTTPRVDESLKALFETGLFADVTLRQEGPILYVVVVENPIINRIAFEGNKKLDDEKLLEEVRLGPRIVYTRAKVQADVQRIVELYRRSGRFSASVEPKVIQLAQNRVDLVFEITEGPVTGVRRISFIGNRKFGDSKLREELATKESRWWRFLTSNDNYDPDRLAYDREVLRRFYLSRGYADFRVISAVAELTPDGKDFFITFTVEEGEQYRFGAIDVETTLLALDPAEMRPLVTTEEGRIYDVEEIDDSIDALIFAAGTKGYAFVDVRPRVTRDRDNRTINIIFQVDEGPRVYVERINIIGNVYTLDKVIRREFRLAEGDAFNRILVDRSRSRIRGLGFFKEVEITEEPGSAPDRTVLNVEVEEQATGELTLGAGFSSADRFIVDFSMTQRNLLGRGQFLRLRLSFSDRRQQIDLSFTEPYFLDRELAAGFDIFKVRTDFKDEAGFETDSIGFSLRSAFPLAEFSRIGPRYTLRQDDVRVSQLSCDIGLIAVIVCESQGKTTSSIFSYTYFLDKRDDPIEPTTGYDLSFTQDFAGLGGSERYIRSEMEFNIYRPIEWFGFENVIASFKATGGHVIGLGRDIRLSDRFFKGGQSFRGFDVAGVGPRDLVTNDSLGAEIYGIGTVAVSFPLGLPEEFGILGSLFSDFGTVGRLDDDSVGVVDDLSLRLAVGVGVLWDSPFGPIRVDFAHVLMKEDYDQTQAFRFSAGTRF